VIVLDGSQGEGGGQIVRTAVTLSSVTGIPVTIQNIRAGRQTPGLRPQHVTAIQAAADICDARLSGVSVGSKSITFEPGGSISAGEYEWDVGTAGAATLVMQTILLPLALAHGESRVKIRGGTHVPFSPPGHYLRDVYVPMLLRFGAQVEVYLAAYGWMPEGGGTIMATIQGGARLTGQDMADRGQVERIFGTAIGCNLPAHIPQRIANRAINLLENVDVPVDIRPQRAKGVSTGAGLFLAVELTNGGGGFGELGKKGMPSEVVAEHAVTGLLNFLDGHAAVDSRLADQLVLPCVLAEGESVFSAPEFTDHLHTNLAVAQAFVDRPVRLDMKQHTITLGQA
jgi:RNA 3'-terminal phosphate cyclase (ATP)